MDCFNNFEYQKKNGLNDEEILCIEKRNNWILPDFYKKILNYSDGLELDEGDVCLFGSKYIEEANNSVYETDTFIPGYLSIGCMGGGEILIAKQEKRDKCLYIFEFGTLCPGQQYMTVRNIEKWFLDKCPVEKEFYHKIY